MKYLLAPAVVFTSLAVAPFAVGVPLAHADDASHLALAKEVITITHTVDNMHKTLPTMLMQIRPVLQQRGMDATTVNALMERMGQKLDQSLDNFANAAAQAYAKELSEDDLKALIAFYKTPAGQDVVAKQPVIAQSLAMQGAQWGQDVARTVIADYLREQADKVAPQQPQVGQPAPTKP